MITISFAAAQYCLPGLILTLFLTAMAHPAGAEPVTIEAEPLQASPLPVAGTGRFFGALRLRANHRQFGGFSSMCIDGHGDRLLAVSDRGAWIAARLTYDSAGRLTGVGQAEIGQLKGGDGKPLLYRDTDAEALTCLPDGSAIVAFERNHRLLHYPPAHPPFSKAPARFPSPHGMDRLPVNFGVEALAHLGEGVLVAISEMADQEQNANSAWLRRDGAWRPFLYVPQTGFRVTDAAATETGDLLVLEHHYNPFLGNIVRVAHVPKASIGEDRRVQGRQLVLIGSPLSANFEGLAVRFGTSGEHFVYLISDNNFQNTPTILLMLKLDRNTFSLPR